MRLRREEVANRTDTKLPIKFGKVSACAALAVAAFFASPESILTLTPIPLAFT